MEDCCEKLNDGSYDCRFNEGCHCYDLNCSCCGWNPIVAKARLEGLLKKMGVKTDG